MKHESVKKLMALLLTVAMCLSLLPAAYAGTEDGGDEPLDVTMAGELDDEEIYLEEIDFEEPDVVEPDVEETDVEETDFDEAYLEESYSEETYPEQTHNQAPLTALLHEGAEDEVGVKVLYAPEGAALSVKDVENVEDVAWALADVEAERAVLMLEISLGDVQASEDVGVIVQAAALAGLRDDAALYLVRDGVAEQVIKFQKVEESENEVAFATTAFGVFVVVEPAAVDDVVDEILPGEGGDEILPGDGEGGDENLPGDGEGGGENLLGEGGDENLPGNGEGGGENLPGDDEGGENLPGDDEGGENLPGDDEGDDEKQPGDEEGGEKQPGDEEGDDEKKPDDEEGGDEKQPSDDEGDDEKQPDDEEGDDEKKPDDDEGGDEKKPDDDEGGEKQPGDDEGGDEKQPGDDEGDDEKQPGDDEGDDEKKPDDEEGGDEKQPGDDEGDDEKKPDDEDEGDDEKKPGDEEGDDEKKPGDEEGGDENQSGEDEGDENQSGEDEGDENQSGDDEPDVQYDITASGLSEGAALSFTKLAADGEQIAALQERLEKGTIVSAFELEPLSGGIVSETGAAEITIPNYVIANPEKTVLIHFTEEGTEELKYDYVQSETGIYLSFSVTGFSPFALVEVEPEEEPAEEPAEELPEEPSTEEDGYLPPLPNELIDENTPLRASVKNQMSLRLLADSPAGNETFITDFYTQAFYGGAWTDTNGDGTASVDTAEDHYLWTANYSAAGHRFSFRVNFAVSNMSGIDPEGVQIRIPKRVLKDRTGAYADEYEMSVPTKADVDSGATVADTAYYAYYEDGDDIVIYNFRRIESEQQGYVEVSYRTAKTSFNYEDMAELGVFTASMTAGDKSATAEPLHVMIDTTAKIKSVKKNAPTMSKTWDDKWGAKPADAGDYIYLVWMITTELDPATTQPYTLDLADSIVFPTDMELVGYKMSGEAAFTADGSKAVNQTRVGTRYDHVLTRLPKDPYNVVDRWTQAENQWKATNSVTATVTPEDGKDAPSSATSKRDYVYHFKTDLSQDGLWQAWKRADGTARTYGAGKIFKDAGYEAVFSPLPYQVGEYTRYDLDEFQRGAIERYDNFDFLAWGVGYTGMYSAAQDENGHYMANDPDAYFKNKVTYVLTDDVFDGDDYTPGARRDQHEGKFLEDEGDTLELTSSADFQLDKLYFNIYVEGGTYNADENTFDKTNGVYALDDIVTIYLKFGNTGSGGTWVRAGSVNYGTGATEFEPGYATAITANSITPQPGCVSWKLVTSHSHYFESIGAVPYYSLASNGQILNYVQEKEKITLYNGSNFRVFTADAYDPAESADFLATKIFDRSRYDMDFATGAERDSSITKSVASGYSDNKLQQYVISWRVNMQENMKSGKDGSLSAVTQNGGVFYDLLPAGCSLDPGSVAVRSASDGYLSSGDFTVEQIMNYNGTGRSMLKVKVLKPGINYSLYFNTIHPWTSIKDYGHDVYNPVAYETGNDYIADGCADNGGTLDDAALMADLDPETDDERFIYAQNFYDITTIVSAATGLQKLIREENDADFSYKTWTNIDGNYVYRLRYSATANMTADDLIFFDSLENYTGDGIVSDWYGTLQDVDVSQPVSMGLAPVVYLNADRVDVSGFSPVEDWDAVLASGWMEQSAFLAAGHTLADAKAIAIDLRRAANGSTYELDSLESLTVMLYMKAPPNSVDTEHVGYPWAYNNIYLSGIIHHSDGTDQPFYNHHDYTAIGLKITGDVELLKVNAENELETIPDISFHLWGTSDYGAEIDMIESSNSLGQVNFNNVEKGTYLLQEYDAGNDWLLNATEYTVKIDDYGRTTIDGQVYEDIRLTVKDPPRVHGDLEFLKLSLFEFEGTRQRIEGVRFKLSGTSDYGNDVLLYSTSDATGRVSFLNIEKGTYELVELETNPDYILNPTVFHVQVNDIGAVSILREDGTKTYLSEPGSALAVYNPPRYWNFSLVKLSREKDETNNHTLEGAEFSLTGTSSLGTKYDLTAKSDATGLFHFDDVEPGTYTLKETAAPHDLDEDGKANTGGTLNYVADPNEYIVVVKDDGSVTIDGLEKDEEGTFGYKDAFKFFNTPKLDKHITVYKTWDPAPPEADFDFGERTAEPAGDKTGPTVHISTKDPTVAPSPAPGDEGAGT